MSDYIIYSTLTGEIQSCGTLSTQTDITPPEGSGVIFPNSGVPLIIPALDPDGYQLYDESWETVVDAEGNESLKLISTPLMTQVMHQPFNLDPSLFYVQNETLTLREFLPYPDTLSVSILAPITWSNVPQGTVITVDETVLPPLATTEDFELTVTVPGEYRVSMMPPVPYATTNWKVQINAV